MSLLGHRAWWLPAWLDRILPNIDLEGDEHEAQPEADGSKVGQPDEEREPCWSDR